MVEALTLEKLNNEVQRRYEYGEQRIVGIMLARYGIRSTQELIEQNYLYWNRNTKRYLDIFWAGYGKYLPPDEESYSKMILNFAGNENRVYFDLDAFISIKEQLNKFFKSPYEDKLQLVLTNYREGKLHFDESIRIGLEDNIDRDYATIRSIMEFVTLECHSAHEVKTIAQKMKISHLIDTIKGVTLSDILSTAVGIAGLVP